MTSAAAEPSLHGGELRAEARARLRRWHALSGIVPLAAFLILHILVNARALAGQAAFDRAAEFVDGFPLRAVLEIVFVLAPLLFHAGYGVVLMRGERAREPSPYAPSWHVLSRGAAGVALAFIAYHSYAVRYARWANGVGAGAIHTLLTAHLSSATGTGAGLVVPWIAIVYLVGIAATVLHTSIGAWGYLVRYEHVTTPRAVRLAAIASGAVGVVLFALASLTVISLASGSPLYLAPPPAAPCPTPP